MSTDSEESEVELDSKRKVMTMQQFKWTPENEELLEQVLMKNFFDFHASAKEFSKIINENFSISEAGSEKVWYNIDAKSLQLRWTDIEIRKYRLNQQ